MKRPDVVLAWFGLVVPGSSQGRPGVGPRVSEVDSALIPGHAASPGDHKEAVRQRADDRVDNALIAGPCRIEEVLERVDKHDGDGAL